MTREHKLALILSFAMILSVGVLVSEHFSSASRSRLVDRDFAPDDAMPLVRPPGTTEKAPTMLVHTPDGKFLAINDYAATIEPEPIEPVLALADLPPEIGDGQRMLEGVRRALAGNTQLSPAVGLDTVSLPSSQLVMGVRPEEPVVREPRLESPVSASRTEGERAHTVREGETLWSIAERYYGSGSVYAQLAQFNRDRLIDGEHISVGTTLRIPRDLSGRRAAGGASPARESAASPSPQPRTPAAARTYTVKSGDSLGVIAQRELGTVKRMQEIMVLNGDQLSDENSIRVGMVLKLPAR